MVHDQEEPPLINELGFAIQPGTHTFCGLRKEVVRKTRSVRTNNRKVYQGKKGRD